MSEFDDYRKRILTQVAAGIGVPYEQVEANFELAERSHTLRSYLERAVLALGATRAEGVIGGLWNVPGHPELTTGQLLQVYHEKFGGSIDPRRDVADA